MFAAQCQHRWRKVLTPGRVKGQWREEEDNLVSRHINVKLATITIQFVAIPIHSHFVFRLRVVQLSYLVSQGYHNWGKIAQEMPGRNSKQCRERWINYLDPKNLHVRFSPDEDEKLLLFHGQFGNRWAQIARLLPGRSVSMINSLISRAL